jgi:cytoskeletal protein CcmA (bactofilin family)
MKQQETDNRLPNNILAGTKIIGSIDTSGDFRIDGQIDGNITSKGKVVIGTNGSIKGEIICVHAEISGNLEGKISVTELLSLKSSSKIIGDIKTGKLSIEPGAIFSGSCVMGSKPSTSPINPILQDKK